MIVQFSLINPGKYFHLKCLTNNGELLSKKTWYTQEEFLKLLKHCQEGLEIFHTISPKYAPVIMFCHLNNLKVSKILKGK